MRMAKRGEGGGGGGARPSGVGKAFNVGNKKTISHDHVSAF